MLGKINFVNLYEWPDSASWYSKIWNLKSITMFTRLSIGKSFYHWMWIPGGPKYRIRYKKIAPPLSVILPPSWSYVGLQKFLTKYRFKQNKNVYMTFLYNKGRYKRRRTSIASLAFPHKLQAFPLTCIVSKSDGTKCNIQIIFFLWQP